MNICVNAIILEGLKKRVSINITQEMGIENIADLIEYIDSLYKIKEKGFNYEEYIVLVNGMKVNKEYKIKDGDDIVFLTPVCGG